MQTNIVAYGLDVASNTLKPLPMSGGGIIVVVTFPQPTGNSFRTVTTSATGANFTAYAAYACNTFKLLNYTDYALDFKLNGAGNILTVPALQQYTFTGITDMSQLSIRRNDQSNTQLTIVSEAYTA